MQLFCVGEDEPITGMMRSWNTPIDSDRVTLTDCLYQMSTRLKDKMTVVRLCLVQKKKKKQGQSAHLLGRGSHNRALHKTLFYGVNCVFLKCIMCGKEPT